MRRRLVLTAALALVLVATSACGARWTDDQKAAIAARGATAESGGPGTTLAPGTDSGATDGSTATGGDAAGVGGDGGTPGTTGGTAGGTGGGSSGPTAAGASGPKPCAAASTAPGVTDDQIQMGTISSLSGPAPGLGASASAAARAYVAYRNSIGGVCGRKIALRQADDGTDSGRYRSIVGDLGPKVFGLVGGFALGDVGGAELVKQQALPVINTPSGDAASAAPTLFDINPGFANPHAVIGKYKYLRAHGASRVSLVYLAVDQSRAEANLQKGLMQAAGIQVAQVQELPISTLSYDSAARSVANSKADYLWFVGTVDGEASMARAMKDTGYHLNIAEYVNFGYGTQFIQLAGSNAEGATTWLRSLPNEERASNAELDRFLTWMARTSPNDAVDAFAVDSWASAKAFFDNLEALPGPITRAAFVTQVRGVRSFDAGGMFGAIQLGAERTNGCAVGLKVVQGKWQRLAPATGFLC